MNEELFEFLATADNDELRTYIDELLGQIEGLEREVVELRKRIADYANAIDNLADTIGEATGDLVGDELIDY